MRARCARLIVAGVKLDEYGSGLYYRLLNEGTIRDYDGATIPIRRNAVRSTSIASGRGHGACQRRAAGCRPVPAVGAGDSSLPTRWSHAEPVVLLLPSHVQRSDPPAVRRPRRRSVPDKGPQALQGARREGQRAHRISPRERVSRLPLRPQGRDHGRRRHMGLRPSRSLLVDDGVLEPHPERASPTTTSSTGTPIIPSTTTSRSCGSATSSAVAAVSSSGTPSNTRNSVRWSWAGSTSCASGTTRRRAARGGGRAARHAVADLPRLSSPILRLRSLEAISAGAERGECERSSTMAGCPPTSPRRRSRRRSARRRSRDRDPGGHAPRGRQGTGGARPARRPIARARP